jgi:Zn-dependent protease with chaperone function
MMDLHFLRELLPIALLLLLLELKLPARLRDLAARITPRPWLQTLLFAAPFLLLLNLLELPIGAAAHRILVRYGLSVQHWPGWAADAAKFVALETVIGLLITLVLFWRIRISPRRWWLQSWAIVMLFVILGVLVMPVVIDPLFNKFEPLQQTDPALVTQLEQVVARSGVSIPPSRIFLMRASAKTNETNAYVTGFGASKRVVVWDTTIKNMPPDEIAFIFAHEMGHYVLRHVPRSIAFTAVVMFLCFWIGARVAAWMIRRFGLRWGIASLQDPAALAILLLVLAAAQFLTEPIGNIYSRRIEHAADVYGQEAMHGLIPDPRITAAQSFQRLGEENLDTPERRPLIEWWTYSHPAIADRITFAAAYDPWVAGAHPRYFQR